MMSSAFARALVDVVTRAKTGLLNDLVRLVSEYLVRPRLCLVYAQSQLDACCTEIYDVHARRWTFQHHMWPRAGAIACSLTSDGDVFVVSESGCFERADLRQTDRTDRQDLRMDRERDDLQFVDCDVAVPPFQSNPTEPANWHHHMVFDEPSNRLFLFGLSNMHHARLETPLRWERVMNGCQRNGLHSRACAVLTRHVFLLGGDKYARDTSSDYTALEKKSLSADCNVFDCAVGRWCTHSLEFPLLPEPRAAAAAVAVNGKIILTGGVTRDGIQNSVLVIDPFSRRRAWELLPASMLRPRAFHSAVALDGVVYICGGGDEVCGVSSSVECIDLNDDHCAHSRPVFTPLPPMNHCHAKASLLAIH